MSGTGETSGAGGARDVRAIVTAVVAEHAEVPAGAGAPLDVDSLTLVQIVEALEDALSVRVAAREVTRANFGTLDAMIAFFEAKR